jgi:predicted nucleic acid-binding protein
MRALVDVNVIIALLDSNHAFHEQAHAWWDERVVNG